MSNSSRYECNVYLQENGSWGLELQGERRGCPVTLPWCEPVTPYVWEHEVME